MLRDRRVPYIFIAFDQYSRDLRFSELETPLDETWNFLNLA